MCLTLLRSATGRIRRCGGVFRGRIPRGRLLTSCGSRVDERRPTSSAPLLHYRLPGTHRVDSSRQRIHQCESVGQRSVAEDASRACSYHSALLTAFRTRVLGATRTFRSLVWPSALVASRMGCLATYGVIPTRGIAIPAVGASSSTCVTGDHLRYTEDIVSSPDSEERTLKKADLPLPDFVVSICV